VYILILFNSEVFGAAEDDSPEMDHSEDSENGELAFEMAKLCLDAMLMPANS
jgi:hypothetical protein